MQSKRKQSRTFEDSEGEAVQGRWTKDEHQRFVEALSIHGKNWKKVEEYVGSRSGAQIRSHAQKFFNRLEKEFNKQFNGLKSSEIKQIFENKMFHNYSDCDQSQKRQRAGSINDISDDDIHSMQIESNQQRLQIKLELEKGQLDLDLPDQSDINNNVQEQISKYKLQQNKLQKKMQDMTDPKSYPDELLKEICDLKKEKDEILAIQQIQNAYQYISEVNEQEKMEEQQNQLVKEVQQQAQDSVRPAPDESFYHFIVAKIQKYLNQKILNLSDLIQVPKIQEEKNENQEEVEVQRSRKQSFTFYNDQGEENQQRYQTLKKVKKD